MVFVQREAKPSYQTMISCRINLQASKNLSELPRCNLYNTGEVGVGVGDAGNWALTTFLERILGRLNKGVHNRARDSLTTERGPLKH